jgi:hypothetical protein
VRTTILVAVLAMILVLGGLTVVVVIRNGPDPLTVVSLLVLALFVFGILGALREPPPPR